jgi:hypothetical protein
MRSRILIIGLLSMVTISSQARGIEDSIYADIYRFTVNMEGPEFKTSHFKSPNYPFKWYICIYDILDTLETDSKINMSQPVGVYLFRYVGLGNEYVLIKYRDSFTIFKKYNIYDIIERLFKINRRDSKILTDELLIKYIQRLVKMNNAGTSLGVKIGELEYIFKSVNDYYW